MSFQGRLAINGFFFFFADQLRLLLKIVSIREIFMSERRKQAISLKDETELHFGREPNKIRGRKSFARKSYCLFYLSFPFLSPSSPHFFPLIPYYIGNLICSILKKAKKKKKITKNHVNRLQLQD